MMPMGALIYGSSRRAKSMPSQGSKVLGLLPDLAAAEHDVLLRGEALQAHGPSRVQLVGRDADLRAEAVFEAVGEARGSVHQYGARIHLAQEAPGARFVFGDDGVGMLRAVLAYVLDRLFQILHHAHREDGREVLGVPVLLRGGLHPGDERAGFFVATQLHALAGVDLREPRQHLGRDLFGYQQRLHRVAHAVALRLRVVGDADRLVGVGALVDIDVAYPVEVLDHRDARFAHHALDQVLAAARHDDVHVFVHREEHPDRGAIRGHDHLHRVFRKAYRAKALVHARGDRQAGAHRFRAAAQDAGVARFQAQRRGVGGHVGTRFVDDADHAQGHAHLADLDPGRLLLQFAHVADRIGQLRDLLEALRHRFDAFLRERQAVDERRVLAGRARGLDVLDVRGEKLFRVAPHGFGGGEKRAVLGVGPGARNLARGGARPAAHLEHVGLDVQRSVHRGNFTLGGQKASPTSHSRTDGTFRGSKQERIFAEMETNNRIRTGWSIKFGLADNPSAIGLDSFPASSANKCNRHLSVRPMRMPVSILNRPVPYVFALNNPYTIGVHSLAHAVIVRARNDSYRDDEPTITLAARPPKLTW